MRWTTPQNVSARPTLVPNLLSQRQTGGVAVENGKSKNEKNNTRCMTQLDAAKLIEEEDKGRGRDWVSPRRSEVTYSLTMEWNPKRNIFWQKKRERKKLRKWTIKDNVICSGRGKGGIHGNGIPFEKMLINFHLKSRKENHRKTKEHCSKENSRCFPLKENWIKCGCVMETHENKEVSSLNSG